MKNLVTGLTPHAIKARRDHVTATDCPAVMGTSPWKTAYDVWAEKNLDLEPAPGSDAMVWGTLLEEPLIKFAEAALTERFGRVYKASKRGCRRVHKNNVMSCTLDAVFVRRKSKTHPGGPVESLECKTHALIHSNVDWDAWGEPFTDCVPDHYRDQVLSQLACCPELERVFVCVCVGFSVPRIYVIEREKHAARIAEIENKVCDFWDNHILLNLAPEGVRTLTVIKRDGTKRKDEPAATLPDALLEQYKSLTAQIGGLEKTKDETAAAIRAQMVGFRNGKTAKGHSLSFTTVNASGYEVAPKTYDRMNVKLAKVA